MEETHFMFSSDMGYYPFLFFLDSMFANSLSHKIYINTNTNATVHSLPLHPVINVLISAYQAIKYLSFFDIHIINGGPVRWQVCLLSLAQYCKRWTSSWWVLICNVFSISELFVGNSVV